MKVIVTGISPTRGGNEEIGFWTAKGYCLATGRHESVWNGIISRILSVSWGVSVLDADKFRVGLTVSGDSVWAEVESSKFRSVEEVYAEKGPLEGYLAELKDMVQSQEKGVAQL